jgi:hypothetical protein
MKNHLLSLFIWVGIIFYPLISIAQGNSYFSNEHSNDLWYISGDPETSSVLVSNKAKEQRKVYVGDILGSDQAEVFKVTYRRLTLQTKENIVDKNGNTYEQLGRIDIQLLGTPCLQNMLPWLQGAWELKYHPNNSKTNWLFFNNKTCQVGLMLNDGRVTGAQFYEVGEQGDGTLTINFEIERPQSKTVYVHLTVSSDRSRIYEDNGAYYSKVSDNFRDMNDRSFRKKRINATDE